MMADVHHLKGMQYATTGKFTVMCTGWTEAVGFSELAGFSSTVGSKEYSYNDRLGNALTKQIGRPSPPTISLKRGLDRSGFMQLFAWHQLARSNVPFAKIPGIFIIYDAAGIPVMEFVLHNAWCSKLELDAAQAGSSNVIQMKVTIECDSIDAA